jgi:glycosyltransferase involved in cell wall biosynthesis
MTNPCSHNTPSALDGRHVLMVSLEPLDRTTAAGNHIEAVRSAIADVATVTVAGGHGTRSVRRYATASLRFLRTLRKADVGYVRQHPLTLPLVAVLRLLRVPVILEVNGPATDIGGAHGWASRLAGVFAAALKWSVRLSAGLVVPTEGMRDYISTGFARRPVAVIPAGFDGQTFNPAPRDALSARPVPGPYVCFVGANTTWQGVEVIIAAALEPTWPSDIGIVLVGDFETLDDSEISARGITLERTGRLAPAEVAAVYRGALASLSPKTYQSSTSGSPNEARVVSRTTGQAPLKVYESLACGTPCIVSDVPIQNDIVASTGGGIVVAVDDPAALAAAVVSLHTDSARRHTAAENALAGADQYSWAALASQTVNFVERSIHDTIR